MVDASPPPIVTLLTDFGTTDTYAGVMKGVILRALPDAGIIDLTHGVPAQDVRAGAFHLLSAYRYFPPGTVHLVIVDPGVGSNRRIIAADAGEHRFLGPDNGVLWPALVDAGLKGAVAVHAEVIRRAQGAALPPGARVSSTFHGRDKFAPVACLLARGERLECLGEPLRDMVTLPLPEPETRDDGAVIGEVIHIDAFGNLVTNIRRGKLPDASVTFEVRERAIVGVAETYVSKATGELMALYGSSGRIEISVRDGNAAALLSATIGDAVTATAGAGARGLP